MVSKHGVKDTTKIVLKERLGVTVHGCNHSSQESRQKVCSKFKARLVSLSSSRPARKDCIVCLRENTTPAHFNIGGHTHKEVLLCEGMLLFRVEPV